MRLILKHPDGAVNEYQFDQGPITIGRHVSSKVFIPNKAISREHAVIFQKNGSWFVKDLGSANKTYVNCRQVEQAEINEGDCIRLASYQMDVKFGQLEAEPTFLESEETVVNGDSNNKIIIRRPDSKNCPSIKIPGKRLQDFIQASEEICQSHTLDKILRALIHIAFKQFSAYRAWGALRDQSTGVMPVQVGKTITGTTVDIDQIEFKDRITEVLEKNYFLLITKVEGRYDKRYQSLMAVPILSENGQFGVFYMDNLGNHPRFNHCDLDYLILLAIHTATVIENF